MDPVESARVTSHILRERERVDFVVAVTHMRLEEDLLVARACTAEVDIILGGHDHDFSVAVAVEDGHIKVIEEDNSEGDIRIVKSGTDFRSYSRIHLDISKIKGKPKIRKVRGDPIIS